jgi:hypothetical protein
LLLPQRRRRKNAKPACALEAAHGACGGTSESLDGLQSIPSRARQGQVAMRHAPGIEFLPSFVRSPLSSLTHVL